jgi:hypothetical protein
MSLDIYGYMKNRYDIFDAKFIHIFSSGVGPLLITDCDRHEYHVTIDTRNCI